MVNLDFEELDKEHRSKRLRTQKRQCKLKEQHSQERGSLRDEGPSGEVYPQAEEGQRVFGATFGGFWPLPIGGVVCIHCQGG